MGILGGGLHCSAVRREDTTCLHGASKIVGGPDHKDESILESVFPPPAQHPLPSHPPRQKIMSP